MMRKLLSVATVIFLAGWIILEHSACGAPYSTKMSDKLMTNLDTALNVWCPEHPDHTTDTDLKYIWVESGKHPQDFVSVGVPKLITDIQSQDFFNGCEQAKNLEVRMFDKDGEIQKVRNLYDELYYCDPDNR